MEATMRLVHREEHGLVFDPRTKILLLITITSLMLSTGNEGVMNIIKPILSIVPFLLLLSEKRMKTAGKYVVLYGVCFAIERLAMSWEGGLVSFILLAVCSIMTRFAPGIMTGAFVLESTTVSEFIAAMHRMHISEKIIIPLSVIFRFFPTIGEESRAISDAMRMRGIKLDRKNPILLVEYRLIPLMVSVVKIGEELSAAALTRGLGAPVKRTNICKIGFHMQDVLVMMLCLVCFIAYFVQRQAMG